MTRRTKLELDINKPVVVEMLYDEPISGRSEFGNYNMYAVSVKGDEYSFFAPEEVHKELKFLRKGATATITKVAQQKGSKLITRYEVDIFNRVPKPSAVSVGDVIDEIIPDVQIDYEPDEFFHLMKRSYSDALKINTDLNGMADPAKIAITLFIARSKSI